jgi:hypothetical protein
MLAVAPNLAQGPIIRRERAVRVAARWDTNAWACRALDRLRERHGPDPVLVNVFGRRVLVLLSARVAARAGNSIEVLLQRYAKCIDSRFEIANRRIEGLLHEYE